MRGLVNKTCDLFTTDCVENIDAQRVFGYALFKDGRNTRLSYPLEKFHSNVSGRSFHNGRFIQKMREKAATLPKYVFSSIANLIFLLLSTWLHVNWSLNVVSLFYAVFDWSKEQ